MVGSAASLKRNFERFGGTTPKQYLNLAGQPLLRHSLAALTGHPAVDGVRAVIDPDEPSVGDAAHRAGLLQVPFRGRELQSGLLVGTGDHLVVGLEHVEFAARFEHLELDGRERLVRSGVLFLIVERQEVGQLDALRLAERGRRGRSGDGGASAAG